MKDEIKEILDNINDKWEDYYVQDIVSGNDLKQLLDYITNLQKKYDEADYDRHKLFEAKEKLQNDYQEAVDKITNLQEENKRLKELCDKYEEEHNTTFKLWKGKLKETMDETLIQKQHDRIKELEQINEEHRKINGELRKTINKAIEYIETLPNYRQITKEENNIILEIDDTYVDDLLNILQGGDE